MIDEILGSTEYFAHPYHSWERGLHEKANGLIRQYLPKRTDFAKVTETQVRRFRTNSTTDSENVLAGERQRDTLRSSRHRCTSELKPPSKMHRKSMISGTRIFIYRSLRLAFLASFLFISARLSANPHLEERDNVYFYETGLVDFSVPEYEILGSGNTGMYGIFSKLLRENDYKVSYIQSIKDVRKDTYEKSALFLINPKIISLTERNLLLKFVESGGRLYVTGDHTNLSATMDSVNSLIEPLGAEFKFDSVFSSSDWRVGYHYSNNNPFFEKRLMNTELGWSTGCSVDLKSPAWRPIIWGRNTFADLGNVLNDTNMGDRRLQYGELRGTICVAATRSLGDGEIFIFGDSSFLQNISITHSFPLVHSLLQNNNRVFSWTGGEIFVLGIGLILSLRWLSSIALSSVFLSFVTLCSIDDKLHLVQEKIKYMGGKDVFISRDSFNNFTLEKYRSNSLDGLLMNFYRADSMPMVESIKELDFSEISPGSLVCILSPRAPLSFEFQQKILNHVEAGGSLLMTLSPYGSENTKLLAKILGFEIQKLPLGPVPIMGKLPGEKFVEQMRLPQFSEAYPIEYTSAGWSSLFEWRDYTIIAHRQFGSGDVALIADEEFLLDQNLESEREGWPGNIKLFKDVYTKIR